ncbi:hypothetical protein CMASS_09565 [Corynebacterium massiliense DSM 45435]|uniref:Uncharacterized protein n=1 Tax=Corynebacterium massiliense DSM 45435 TaxID=1121364 RepID=A0ABY7U9M8_9CORY|nr:hypothetical protein CMASS_09565 [Corynebacterium massiliense DSM 45435]
MFLRGDGYAAKFVLITCGGEFVGGQLGYAENIITVAEPID